MVTLSLRDFPEDIVRTVIACLPRSFSLTANVTPGQLFLARYNAAKRLMRLQQSKGVRA